MSSNIKLNLTFIGLLFIFSPILVINLGCINNNSSKNLSYNNDFPSDVNNLKLSDASGKIHIDNNWTAAKAAGICTGNGTYSKPYIIKNLVIDGGGSGDCILIGNSSVYIKIENCTLNNYVSGPSGWSSGYGIRLLNVNNSQIIDNHIFWTYKAIVLHNCYNNSISGNTANENLYHGITVKGDDNFIIGNKIANSTTNWWNYFGIDLQGNNNTVSDNTIFNYKSPAWEPPDYYVGGGGMHIEGFDNKIIGNSVSNNNITGILLNGDMNKVIGNNVSNNSEKGISIVGDANNIIRNNISHNGLDGLFLDGNNNEVLENILINNSLSIGGYNFTLLGNLINRSGLDLPNDDVTCLKTYNIDTTNLVNGKLLHYYSNKANLVPNNFSNAGQIILVNCSESMVSNFNISYTTTGIGLYSCKNSNISANILHTNRNGIYLYNSINNIISENIGSDNIVGLALDNCNNTNVSGNNLSNNIEYGCSILGGYNCNISFNELNYNGKGLDIHYGYKYNISYNELNYNDEESYISSDNSTISRNNASYNEGHGIRVYGIANIKQNIANHNSLSGLYIACVDGYVFENLANNNGNYGIILTWNDPSETSHCTAIGNTANNNMRGIGIIFGTISSVAPYLISKNFANNNFEDGIYVEGKNVQILGNTLINNKNGIHVQGGGPYHGHTIIGNTINYSTNNGIFLDSSDFCYLSENMISNSMNFGIYLKESNYNNISGNILLGNGICIRELNCEGNSFSDNGDCTYGQGDGEHTPSQFISGYNAFLLLSILSIVPIIVIKKMKKS